MAIQDKSKKISASAFLADVQEPQAKPSIQKPSAREFLSDLPDSTITQKAGPLVSPTGLMRKLKPKKEDIPELIGATAGAVTGGIPGAMLGGGAGAAFKQLGQRAGILEGEAPTTQQEAARGIVGGGIMGGFAEVGGRVLGRLISPFSKSVTPGIKAGMKAAERAGIKPPISAQTEHPLVQAGERYAEISWPFGSGVTARKKQAIKQFGDYAERIGEGIAPDKPPELVGELAKNKVIQFEKTFKKAKDALYEPINTVLNDKPVDPTNTITAIKTVLERRSGGKEGQSLLKDWLDRLSPGYEVPGMATPRDLPTFSRLKAIRTEIGSRGSFNDPGVTGIKSDLEYIYSAASKDMDDLASQHGMKDALDAVNSQYSKGIKKLQNSLVKAINTRAEKSPESLYKLVIRQDSPTLIKTGKEILGEDGFGQMRLQWFDDLLARSKSTIEGEEVLSPAKLSTNLRKMGSSLPEMFSDNPQLAKQIQDLTDVSKLLTRGQKITQGSQTAFATVSIARNLRGSIAALLMKFPGGREYLTTGFPRFSKAVTRTAQPVIQRGLQMANE